MKKIPVISIIIVLVVSVMVVASCSSATSAPTTVTPTAAVRLVFTKQPVQATAGSPLTTQPVVAAEGANGDIVTGFRGQVDLAIASGTGVSGASLFGGTTLNLLNGVAMFKGLSIDQAGTGYKLMATCTDLTPAISSAFSVVPGTPFGLAYTTQPAGATAGSAFTTVVAVTDKYGNVITGSTVPITLSLIPGIIGSHSGPDDVTISGTTTANAINGVATFAGLSINLAGNGFKLVAKNSGLGMVVSDPFDITSGTPVKLAFAVQPAEGTAKSAFNHQPVVWVEDAEGNICTSSDPPVTISIAPDTGTKGAILSGKTTINAVNAGFKGVAPFQNLSINLDGSGYKLLATSSGLSPATSSAFDIAPAHS